MRLSPRVNSSQCYNVLWTFIKVKINEFTKVINTYTSNEVKLVAIKLLAQALVLVFAVVLLTYNFS